MQSTCTRGEGSKSEKLFQEFIGYEFFDITKRRTLDLRVGASDVVGDLRGERLDPL